MTAGQQRHRQARAPLVALLAIIDLVTVTWAVTAALELFR